MRTAETSLKENSVESRGDERIQVLKQVCAKTWPRFHRLATNCAELKLSSQGEDQGMQLVGESLLLDCPGPGHPC